MRIASEGRNAAVGGGVILLQYTPESDHVDLLERALRAAGTALATEETA